MIFSRRGNESPHARRTQPLILMLQCRDVDPAVTFYLGQRACHHSGALETRENVVQLRDMHTSNFTDDTHGVSGLAEKGHH